MKKKTHAGLMVEIIVILLASIIFLVPFYFVVVNSFKGKVEAAQMQINWPEKFQMLENYKSVLSYRNGIIFRAFKNSILLTAFSVIGIITVSAMASYVLQRRKNKFFKFFNFLIMIGLIIPPAIVPTYWVLNTLHVYGKLISLVLVEVAINFSFATLLYTAFMETIPRQIDEAAIIDGCGPERLFFQIVLPLLKPVSMTVLILSMVNVYNDFVNPLYFLSGSKNVTAPLTLYFFQGQFDSSWNLLFADVVLISLPPLVFYIIFNKQMIAGMTAGAVKG